jgi:Na+-transporting NADH:ubiquinone oxidoreductase subunit NqrE
MKTLHSWLGWLGLGIVTDLLVVLYYRSVQARSLLPAVMLSIAITAVPFFVIERSRTKRVWIWYALGCGIGTALGLIV